MKNLVQEAEQYAEKSNINLVGKRTKHRDKYTIADFIAGATSKWVEVKKIKSQIEILKNVDGEFYHNEPIYQVIQNLETLLKQLEDEI
jgi:hypothetical protein